MKTKVILTDIEGTTSSISFVKDVLFPYSYKKLPSFLRDNSKNSEIQTLLKDIEALTSIPSHDIERIISQCLKWIDEDQKVTPLKSLQGLIWKEGYENSDYKAHMYPDAYEKLKQWRNSFPLYVYSSGSILAQKLFFSNTEFGDITSFFSGYFDTSIGNKSEEKSYTQIAEEIKVIPDEILFLTDMEKEVEAAKAAGFQTCLIKREGEISNNSDTMIRSNFHEITIN